jgi:hypothetical protein
MADKTNNIIYNVEVNTNSGKISIDGLTKGFVDADRAVLKLQNDLNKNTKGVDKFTGRLDGASKAAGASTSATLELGRVLSDMPYGIRGVANNLQQLGSNLFFMSKKTDDVTGKMLGFKGAVSSVLKGLMGPAGILIAFQGLIALWDYLSTGTKKAKEETSELNDELERSAKAMAKINTVLDTLNVSGDSINFEWMDAFMAGVDKLDTKGILRVLERDIKGITNAFNKLPKEEQNIKGIESLVMKKKELIDNLLAEKQIKSELGDLDKEFAVYRSLGDSEKKTELSNNIIRKQKELFAVQKAIVDTEELFKKQKEKDKEDRPEVEYFDIKGIKEGQGKVLSEIIKLNDKMLLTSIKDKKSRLIVQRDFHIARLAAIHGNNSEIVQAYKKYYRQLIETAEEGELELLAKEGAKGMGKLKRNTTTDAEDILTARLKKVQDFADRYNQISASVTSFMDGEFQRQLTTEQNKTNAINNELRERLNNENLSADERKNIQLKISRNDEALRRRQEKIKKKQFKLNKAANIASALVSTYSGASAAYFNTLKNPANALDPTAGLVRAKINAGIATALGLANVAMIARQKFQSSISSAPSAGALGSGGGSGSGRGDRSFNFNLAGASRENQLAQTLQGRFDQPLQAYVVSRDITNQQQLDEDIRNNASFG